MVSLNSIIEKGTKKKLLLTISNGSIHKNLLKSVHELSINSRNKFELILHICNETEQYMDILEKFTLESIADVIIFVNSSVGFSHDCINDIFDRCLDSNSMVGVCVPNKTLNLKGINSTNHEYAEPLSRVYDLHLIDKHINVDDKCLMKVRGFQINDIVGLSLSLSKKGDKPIDISRGFNHMKNECILITKHKVSNNGIDGCLFEHLVCIQKVRRNKVEK